MGAYIIAALGVGCACVCLWFLASFKQVYASQMAQTNHALATARAAQAKNANDVKGLSERFDGMAGVINAISAYNQVCSQDLEGQNGPTRFFFACTSQQPGSGS